MFYQFEFKIIFILAYLNIGVQVIFPFKRNPYESIKRGRTVSFSTAVGLVVWHFPLRMYQNIKPSKENFVNYTTVSSPPILQKTRIFLPTCQHSHQHLR